MRPSLYVHVPYCEKKCSYCAFNSAAGRSLEEQDQYVNAVLQELDTTLCLYGPEVRSIYIGGGTPSALPGPLFLKLLRGIEARVVINHVQEWTVEVNPGTLTTEHLSALRSTKVNRVSMGVQTMDPDRLSFLGRVHTVEQVHESVQQLREAGIQRINLDLIYSQPGQTLEAWDNDVNKIIQLQPEHISAYSLQYEEGTPFLRDLQAGRLQPSDEELTREMFVLLEQRVTNAGFHLYEISNFARQNEESRHNQHYWLNLDYHGIGAGAWGRSGAKRYRNICSPAQYIRSVTKSGQAVEETDVLGDKEDWLDCLTSGLRTTRGVALDELHQRTGIDTERVAQQVLAELTTAGLGTLDNHRLCLTRDGLWVLDSIMARFLDYLPRAS